MDALFSKMVKSGRTTYFMDVKTAKNDSKYMSLTASSPSPTDPTKFTKRSVIVFNNVADDLVGALREAREKLGDTTPFSKTLKCGKTTYFLDVREAKNKSKFLTISSTQPSKEDPKKFTKRSIAIFDNAAEEFTAALRDTVDHLK